MHELLLEIYERLKEMDWRSIEKAMDGYDEDFKFIRNWLMRAESRLWPQD